MTTHIADTEPYAWPYDGRVVGRHLALLLVGWDSGWSGRAIDPGGAVDRCIALASAVEATGSPVIATVHAGAEPLVVSAAAQVVAAPAIDAFHDSPLDTILRRGGWTHLLVAGHGIEAAVHSTLRSANDRGYECLLVTDACTALTDDLAAPSAKTVTMSGGIFGAIGTTGPVLDALAATPTTPDPVTAPGGPT